LIIKPQIKNETYFTAMLSYLLSWFGPVTVESTNPNPFT
jgi:hypothetical protein